MNMNMDMYIKLHCFLRFSSPQIAIKNPMKSHIYYFLQIGTHEKESLSSKRKKKKKKFFLEIFFFDLTFFMIFWNFWDFDHGGMDLFYINGARIYIYIYIYIY